MSWPPRYRLTWGAEAAMSRLPPAAGEDKWTVSRVRRCKGRTRLAVLTAYDATTARYMDTAGFPIILVGDSVGMTVLGYDSTLPVTMEDMLHHTQAVMRGVHAALVVADMPFLSFQVTRAQALVHAGRLLKQGGADAVKLEGGAIRAETVQHLVANGVPVMGHIGLTPQSVKAMGGYKVQGRSAVDADRLLDDALALTAAGIFSLVLEGMPADLASRITAAVDVPTIGIGAGPDCDGQVLVVHDLLGVETGNVTPRFVKRYAEVGAAMQEAFAAYKREVEGGQFPAAEHCY